jgi:pyruvate dehydrogenase E2 component (dihydrolipoamide acetyltransferase)
MPEEISMPKLSDTMEEGTLIKWYKAEGDYVQQGETLFEVETDKAVLEVEAFVSGVLSQILVQEGEKVPVGTPIAVIGGDMDNVIPQDEPLVEEPAKVEVSQKPPVQDTTVAPKLKIVPTKKKTGATTLTGDVNASPAARSFAQQRGIDLSQLKGTGAEAMITLKDVRNYKEDTAVREGTLPLVQRELGPSEEITSLSKMRKAIAATVSYSKKNIPHFYVSYEIAMTNVITQLAKLNQKKQDSKNKITINDVIIKAVATTLKNYPYLNAVYPEQGLILKKEVNMGIVIGLPEGLIIPVLKNCDKLTIDEISSGVKRLREKAEAGKFSPDDFTDGTFTISNLGMLGVTDFSAIIYPPQTAIMAVSTIKDTPVIKDGAVVPTKIMKVTLSMDHRVVDGINAATFLRDLNNYMETESVESIEKPCCTVDDD